MVTHLDDILLRRTKTAWVGKVSMKCLAELAAIAGDSLGWTMDQQKGEIERVVTLLRNKHGVQI